jgi:hypothetical protein
MSQSWQATYYCQHCMRKKARDKGQSGRLANDERSVDRVGTGNGMLGVGVGSDYLSLRTR